MRRRDLFLFAAAPVAIPLRRRHRVFENAEEWRSASLSREVNPARTVVLICDMWDRHWCSGATRRVGALAPKVAAFVAAARRSGMTILHAPSETMAFYKDAPQREAMRRYAGSAKDLPVAELPNPKLPIDDSAGGCETGESFSQAWTRQIDTIPIAAADLISDSAAEIFGLFVERGIELVLVTGVHTNMCVLNRSFAIKNMVRRGIRCALVRDLTDSMYDPKASPFVPHERGTELVIEHIEQYWCPTTTSAEVMRALAR